MEEREEDKYEHRTELRCWLCDSTNGKIVDGAIDQPEVRRLGRLIKPSTKALFRSRR